LEKRAEQVLPESDMMGIGGGGRGDGGRENSGSNNVYTYE
jgi:hypothetical protein